jgi:hypothetical protein
MVKGDTNGRWSTMVTISAGPRAWAEHVRWGWEWRHALAKTPLRELPFARSKDLENLRKLSMIGFARWSMFDRIPTGIEKQRASPLRRPFLLFETNFNGDHDAYFEAFSYVVPNPMNRVWHGAYGVPRVQQVSKWQRVIHENARKIAYYYSAYPNASTKMIRSALALELLLSDFRPRAANMTADQFDAAFRVLLGEVERINNPQLPKRKRKTASLTTLIPVDQRRNKHLKQALKSVAVPPLPLPSTTHFARWCLVDELRMPAQFGVDPTSYLLFTSWFDGEREEDYAAALYQHLGPDRATAIWGNCGFAGDGPEAFVKHLMDHSVPTNAAFGGYDGVSVDEVNHVLKLRNRFDRFAVETQDLRGPDLQDAWVKVPELSRAA